MLEYACICKQSTPVGGSMHRVGLQTANAHTKKHKPLVTSARLHLCMFTQLNGISAPVFNTSMDNGVVTMPETPKMTISPVFLLQLSLCSSEDEMGYSSTLPCLGTVAPKPPADMSMDRMCSH